MIEKQMIRLMLNKKFYTQYKGTLSPTVFAGDISSLYETIQKSHLKPYKDLYICLDRDATTKAYDMAKDLRSSGFENVIVKPLEDDLKYYNTEQIREIFYDRKTND